MQEYITYAGVLLTDNKCILKLSKQWLKDELLFLYVKIVFYNLFFL